MDGDDLIRLECITRVQAMTVVISARIEGMKAENAERLSNGYAIAYDAEAFRAEAAELESLLLDQIGAK